ncbi:MAG: PhoPQ-activated pathogenicity-related family protein [Alphaproteobacteria bacterium]|nr:PhoPQ-activated pathogenicity-related family protein [Alphaproteobacteria bacterium]
MPKGVGAVFCSLITAVFASAASADGREETALDRYVAAPDPSYRYELISTEAGDAYTANVLEMTSQRWRTADEVDRPIWKHWLTIVRPEHVTTNTGLLVVSGGSNEKPPPKISSLLTQLALATNSVINEVRMVPNEPLVFAGDGRKLTEDAITAFSWEKFLTSGDETWPLRLPMTKSVVRAMDTITSFCASPAGGGLSVDKFVVGGASKRGWTAWTVAAVDNRVVAIIPVVIDLLNLEPSFDHHYRSYGFWAPAIAEFERAGIMRWAHTPQFEALIHIEDPYSYRERLTMPKFIVNAAGDQYFLPDSSQFYFAGLKGDNYLRYLPNTDHSLKGEYVDAAEGALTFYQSVLSDTPRPKFSWNFEDDGSIQIKTASRPAAVTLWQAHNPAARDFRLATIGGAYSSSNLTDQGDGLYVGKVAEPKQGWTAFFVEMSFPTGGPYSYKFSTGVRVVPDRLPFGPPPEQEGAESGSSPRDP